MSGRQERAWAALSRGRFDVAEQEFRSVLAEEPDDAGSHAALAICLIEREQFDEAEREARLATGLAPESDFPHHVLGRVLRDRHRPAEAIAAAEEAIRLDPDDASNRFLLATIQAQQAAWEPCLEAADRGLALDPEHEGCTNMRALALTHLGRKDEASATIADALRRSPENSITHTNQGWALLHRNDPKQAQVHFAEALRLDPTNDWAREGMLATLKARNPLFRGLLAYFLFMSRQRTWMRWALILGVLFGQRLLNHLGRSHPEFGWIIWPVAAVVAVAVYSTWLADPLMNLVMRFDRHGRHALNPDQYAQANLIGACLLLAGGLFGTELALGLKHFPSFMILLLSIPLTSIHDAAPGWPRRLSTIVATALGLIALFEVFALHLLHLSVLRRTLDSGDQVLAVAAIQLIPVYFIGIMVWSLLAIFWIERVQPRR